MIWLIGGTSDAIKIADLLVKNQKDVLVSTTTDYGSALAKESDIKLIQKRLTKDEMHCLINENSIDTVIDASHPFAQEVSENAISTCKQKNVKYLRYERACMKFSGVNYYSTYNNMVNTLSASQGNILLTIGAKNLHQFHDLKTERIIARVLPFAESINRCEQLGLKAHQIIAMKGRMTIDTNKALMHEYDIQHLVTKDSGNAGGLAEKVEAAKALDVKIHILERPKVDYPTIYNQCSELINELNKK